MLTFWIIAALLILLALWFVVPALLQKPSQAEEVERLEANVLVYKDQYRELEADLKSDLIGETQYQAEKQELERRLLEDVSTKPDSVKAQAPVRNGFAYGVAAFIPLGALVFYLSIGNPKGLDAASAPPTAPAAAAEQPGAMSPQQIAANIDKLAERLKQNPNDAQGWQMLGRSYMMQEKFADAAGAFEHLTAISPKDAGAWTDYAEALALANGQNLSGKPTEAINRALQIDPNNQKALDLAGTAAYQAGDFQKAIEQWQKLLKLLPAGSEELKTITAQISKAKELAGNKTPR
ncbi:MAG TPA: c-type cytochrome biogenesis protein CcmI [Candidatus Eisenbacteria bacterium]|nr:c-type cytochrome biogenesis protein CcmI [Candidatus Eisenbacteria bacterium]